MRHGVRAHLGARHTRTHVRLKGRCVEKSLMAARAALELGRGSAGEALDCSTILRFRVSLQVPRKSSSLSTSRSYSVAVASKASP